MLLDVVCFTEMWLGSEDYNNEILPKNYCTYRRDRGTICGGVLIGLIKSIPSRLYLRGDNTKLINVELLTNPCLILYCVYAPPKSSIDYCTSITNSLGTLPASKNVIIVGEFNCPDINWNCLSGSTDFSTKFCDFSLENNLTQVKNASIHTLGNMLYLVFTNIPEKISNLEIHMEEHLSTIIDHFYNTSEMANPEFLCKFIKNSVIRAIDISTPKFKASSEQDLMWFTLEIRHLQKKLRTLKQIKRNPTSST